MGSTIFRLEGLSVKGTKEDIEQYTSDTKEIDMIKYVIGRLSDYIDKNEEKEPHDFLHHVKTGTGKHLLFYGKVDKSENISKSIMFYDVKTKKPSRDTIVSDLEALKDAENYEFMRDRIMQNSFGMFTEEQAEEIKSLYRENKEEEISGRIDIDTGLKKLKSETGFYVGDPALVLKEGILDSGVRQGKRIQTGYYDVKGLNMLIAPAMKGVHGGHDIYSGAIGVIPLELTDKNKMKAIMDSIPDIRTGTEMNVMMKGTKMYLSQGTIDEIDIVNEDGENKNAENAYSM